jgi:invasion protein IalB
VLKPFGSKAGWLARRLLGLRALGRSERGLINRPVARIFSSFVTLLVMAGCTASALAQQAPKAPVRPTQAQQAPAPNSTPQTTADDAAQQRIEIVTADNWTITCRHPTTASAKKSCSAVLQITQEAQGGARTAVFSWLVGMDPGQKLTSIFMTPTGVAVQRGVDVQISKTVTRKGAFSICEPQHCEAVLALDAATIQAIKSTDQVTVTVTGSRGQQVNFTIYTKGFERMIAQLTS